MQSHQILIRALENLSPCKMPFLFHIVFIYHLQGGEAPQATPCCWQGGIQIWILIQVQVLKQLQLWCPAPGTWQTALKAVVG